MTRTRSCANRQRLRSALGDREREPFSRQSRNPVRRRRTRTPRALHSTSSVEHGERAPARRSRACLPRTRQHKRRECALPRGRTIIVPVQRRRSFRDRQFTTSRSIGHRAPGGGVAGGLRADPPACRETTWSHGLGRRGALPDRRAARCRVYGCRRGRMVIARHEGLTRRGSDQEGGEPRSLPGALTCRRSSRRVPRRLECPHRTHSTSRSGQPSAGSGRPCAWRVRRPACRRSAYCSNA